MNLLERRSKKLRSKDKISSSSLTNMKKKSKKSRRICRSTTTRRRRPVKNTIRISLNTRLKSIKLDTLKELPRRSKDLSNSRNLRRRELKLESKLYSIDPTLMKRKLTLAVSSLAIATNSRLSMD